MPRNSFSTLMPSIREGEEGEKGVEKKKGDEKMDIGESRLDRGHCPPSTPAAGERPGESSLDCGVR